ncbi:MAG: RHS repeat-associated core domain-containing protein, partial [Pseudanabaena sp.]
TQNSYLYTGEQFDAGAGQYYLRDRYYNQAVGRFTRRDVWEGDFGSPLSLHKYSYTNANPINRIDPSGLETTIYVHSGARWYGHAAIDVNGTVYTFGRYGERNENTSLGGLNGDGYLYMVPRYHYLSTSPFTATSDTVSRYSLKMTKSEEKHIVDFYERLYSSGTNPRDQGGFIGVRIGEYQFLANNCTSLILQSLPLGGLEIGVNSEISPVAFARQLEFASSMNFLGLGKVEKLDPIRSSVPARERPVGSILELFLFKFGFGIQPPFNPVDYIPFGLA